MRFRGVLIILLLLSFWACSEDDSDTVEPFFGYAYAPYQVGQERVYQIDSILYNEFTGLVDTTRFQRREVIQASFIDLEGRAALRTQWYERLNDTTDWRLIRVFEQSINNLRFVRREDNFPQILMVFPINETVRWDANALNTSTELQLKFADLHQAFQQEGITYDSTLRVIHRSTINLIQRISTEERYATGVGLISRFDENLQTELNGDIRSGYQTTLRLIDFQP